MPDGEALEVACHDGRLRTVPGVGARRASATRAALADILDRSKLQRRAATTAAIEPPAEVLLDVDREYLEKARAGTLATIAPRRFNPDNRAWLPVLHSKRGDWHFTALFSNTATAHQLGRTCDWVVIYFYGDDHAERQRTVVTEVLGALRGRRVVRGREPECRACYERDELAVAG